MAVQGPFVVFNQAKLKAVDGPVELGGDSFKAVLCNSSQVLDALFDGASGDCRYADLTGELASANGYTNGGVALTGVTLTRSIGVVTWDSADIAWTLTGAGITFKYLVIFDDTQPNKDLVCVCDMDTSGGSISPAAGTLTVQINASGIVTLQ